MSYARIDFVVLHIKYKNLFVKFIRVYISMC